MSRLSRWDATLSRKKVTTLPPGYILLPAQAFNGQRLLAPSQRHRAAIGVQGDNLADAAAMRTEERLASLQVVRWSVGQALAFLQSGASDSGMLFGDQGDLP